MFNIYPYVNYLHLALKLNKSNESVEHPNPPQVFSIMFYVSKNSGKNQDNGGARTAGYLYYLAIDLDFKATL